MGQCYSISFNGSFKDKNGAVKVLKEYIKKESITHHKSGDMDSIEYLMSMLFEGLGYYDASFDNDDFDIDSDFDASYSWEGRMADGVDVLAPYLEDGSQYECYPDYGYAKMTVWDGAAQWESKEYTEFQEVEMILIGERLEDCKTILEKLGTVEQVDNRTFKVDIDGSGYKLSIVDIHDGIVEEVEVDEV